MTRQPTNPYAKDYTAFTQFDRNASNYNRFGNINSDQTASQFAYTVLSGSKDYRNPPDKKRKALKQQNIERNATKQREKKKENQIASQYSKNSMHKKTLRKTKREPS
jgi:hypothetical protein